MGRKWAAVLAAWAVSCALGSTAVWLEHGVSSGMGLFAFLLGGSALMGMAALANQKGEGGNG